MREADVTYRSYEEAEQKNPGLNLFSYKEGVRSKYERASQRIAEIESGDATPTKLSQHLLIARRNVRGLKHGLAELEKAEDVLSKQLGDPMSSNPEV